MNVYNQLGRDVGRTLCSGVGGVRAVGACVALYLGVRCDDGLADELAARSDSSV